MVQNSQIQARSDGGSETDDGLTPDHVRRMGPERTDEVVDDPAAAKSRLLDLLTPESRAAILDALVEAGGEPKTVRELLDLNSHFSTSSFRRQKDDLLAYGVMEEAGMRGNAQAYRLNTDHPVAQLLVELDTVLGFGQTPRLLDERFVGEPCTDE